MLIKNIPYPNLRELVDLIVTHEVSVSWYESIVYARVGRTEVGAKFADFGGDKYRALSHAIQNVTGVTG